MNFLSTATTTTAHLKSALLHAQFLKFGLRPIAPSFSTATSCNSKMNYDRFINAVSARRKISPIRELTKIYVAAPPGTVFLAGGLPNGSTFPFQNVTIDLKDGSTFKIDGKLLETALQYQPTPGFPPLVQQLKDLQVRTHGLSADYWEKNDLIVSTGSQDALCKALEMSLEDGDPILVQEPIYPGTAAIIRPLNGRMIPVQQDNSGLLPERLRAALEKEGTPAQIRSGSKGVPKLLYLNSTGANPTGLTITTERKKEIYKIACEYDLLIIEDDPYFFLHFEDKDPVSFLSLDTENRVLRFDSFSKVLSSGLRVGYVTGAKPLIHRIELHIQASTMHTSALPQVIVSSLLEQWGPEKLQAHFKSIQAFYKSKRDCMLAAAERHLKGLAEWYVPPAGMFLWIMVPGIKDTNKLISEGGMKHGVILLPGKQFMVAENADSPHFRASYTVATPEEINSGFERLAKLIKAEVKH